MCYDQWWYYSFQSLLRWRPQRGRSSILIMNIASRVQNSVFSVQGNNYARLGKAWLVGHLAHRLWIRACSTGTFPSFAHETSQKVSIDWIIVLALVTEEEGKSALLADMAWLCAFVVALTSFQSRKVRRVGSWVYIEA